jgi:hypothetical protein
MKTTKNQCIMKKLLGIIMIFASVLIGCEKEKDCEITNPENLKLNGCFNFMVFDSIKVNGIENSYVLIQVERDKIDLNNQFKSFEIPNNSGITSVVESFNKQSNDCYCSDAIDTKLERLNTWNLQSGTIEIRIVREKSECDETYVVDVILKNATYMDDENNELFIDYKEFSNVLVNYQIG